MPGIIFDHEYENSNKSCDEAIVKITELPMRSECTNSIHDDGYLTDMTC